ncbi:hypothetical protein [Comamonas guangdongensis]|uniref:Flagellar protein FlgJ N-terminal domain-containing protein n=1 Tax=Comamonas guangdongensis TaxID=510515 RepID=A0ABV3ZRZ7_9BURK
MDLAPTSSPLEAAAGAAVTASHGPAVASAAETAQRLSAAAVKFESFFVAQMLKQMRQTTAALADSGSAINDRVNDSALSLAEQSVADSLAGHRAFGIADVLVRQMLPASSAATRTST